jgi:hypothetical protein
VSDKQGDDRLAIPVRPSAEKQYASHHSRPSTSLRPTLASSSVVSSLSCPRSPQAPPRLHAPRLHNRHAPPVPPSTRQRTAHPILAPPARPVPTGAASTPVPRPPTRARTGVHVAFLPLRPSPARPPVRRLARSRLTSPLPPSLLSAGHSRLPSHSNYPAQRLPNPLRFPALQVEKGAARHLPFFLQFDALWWRCRYSPSRVPNFLTRRAGVVCLCAFGDSGAWARICACLPPDPSEARARIWGGSAQIWRHMRRRRRRGSGSDAVLLRRA